MRRIDPNRFHIARRGTSRQINRQIALTLISSHQPISRADLARRMNLRRGAIGLLIDELLRNGHIVEGETRQAPRGRRPTLLFINAERRSSIAVDVRASATYMMVADAIGRPRSDVVAAETPREPRRFVKALARRVGALLKLPGADNCQGIGVVVPGMVDHVTGRVLHAPTLGWRNVDIREPLAEALDQPVHIENSGRACALAEVWTRNLHPDAAAAPGSHARLPRVGPASGTPDLHPGLAAPRDLVFVSVSDGVGVGVVINGELLRGRHNIAGEFAHMPIDLDGPRCSCGATGCWEAYISNPATLSRYARGRRSNGLTIGDLIGRARNGDLQARASLEQTARYLGLGLAVIANTINPSSIVIGGEITTAWDLLAPTAHRGLAERALIPAAAATDLVTVSTEDLPRLRGAALLVAAPAFAAPVVA
jgi:predicted NBD/HSP70 family sugar kinase